MVLVHEPFVPTPDSEEWPDNNKRFEKDTTYFKDMVAYVDKIVFKISNKLKTLGIDKNTIIMFTGDNGTDIHIRTKTTHGYIQGGKGNTTDAGTRVPLIVYWPEKIKTGFVFEHLIEFSDFFPTLADIVDKKVQCDGKSFYPLLTHSGYEPRSTAFVHYDPRWGGASESIQESVCSDNGLQTLSGW
jgi:arylsulfatase A-like enzyme